MKKISYLLGLLALITLAGCTDKSLNKFDLPEWEMSFYYPQNYTVQKDPYNPGVWTVWFLESGNVDQWSYIRFDRGACLPDMVRTGWETTIDGQKFFLKPEETGASYYYYENYPDTRTCTSFSVLTNDAKEKASWENIVKSITFIK